MTSGRPHHPTHPPHKEPTRPTRTRQALTRPAATRPTPRDRLVTPAHLALLGEQLRAALPAFTAENGDLGPRQRILPLATHLLRARSALREGTRPSARTHLLTAALHTAHLAFDGPPEARLEALLHQTHQRLDRNPTSHTPTDHYDRALTEAVHLAHTLDHPTPRRLQTHATHLTHHLLHHLVLTDTLICAVPSPSRVSPTPD